MVQIVIPQNSMVNLYNVHIADDRELVFSSREAQATYFNKYMRHQIQNVSVVKKGLNMIKLQLSMGDVLRCNMLSFINTDFDNKMFYAKIIDYEYVNNNTTAIYYEIDYWQTFMFDIEYYDSMIEREHLSEALYQKALANPQDDSIIELRTPEDITVPEEAYTYTNDGWSQWGSPSKILPASNNDPVFLIQLAPFEFVEDDKGAPVNADGKTLKELLYEYDSKFKRADQTGWGAVLLDWSTKDGADGSKDTGLTSTFGHILAGITGDEEFKKYNKGRDEIIKTFKISNKRRVDNATWDMFRNMFPEFKTPHLAQGAAITCYNAVLEYSDWGAKRMQEAIDFLTLQGVSASILGLYIVPRYILSETINEGQITTVNNPSNSRHPKLNTGEFSFISVQSPDGAKREYRYENFRDHNDFKFVVQASVVGNPVITLAPINYLQDVSNDRNAITIENRIDFDNFPHLPYSTDGYLTYLSGQMAQGQMLKSASSRMNNSLNNWSNVVSGITNGSTGGIIGGVPGAVIGAAAGGIQAGLNNTVNNINRELSIADSDKLYRANVDQVQNIKNGDTPSKLWDGSQKAFVQDHYHAGSTHGWLPYLYSGIRFRLDFKYVNDVYKERYEKYFDHYGYKSTRFGSPRVGLWARGDASQEPHWETVNGLQTTYVKTDGCRVLGPFMNATRQIQRMFDSGIRFIKGDGL